MSRTDLRLSVARTSRSGSTAGAESVLAGSTARGAAAVRAGQLTETLRALEVRRSARGRRRKHALQLRRGGRRRGCVQRRVGRANVRSRGGRLRWGGRRRLCADPELDGGVVRVLLEVCATRGALLRTVRVRPARCDAGEEGGGRSLEEPVARLARARRGPDVHADERAGRARGARARLPERALRAALSTDLPALLRRDPAFDFRELDRELSWLAGARILLRIDGGLGGRARDRRRSRRDGNRRRIGGSVRVAPGVELRATDEDRGGKQRNDERGSLHE
jgi:hypothetical protein